MHGWSLVLTREVNGWLCRLDDATFGRVAYHLDLLRDRGAYLDRPGGGLLRPGEPIRQLAIPDGRRTHRLTYCLDGQGLVPGRGTIVALTVRRWWRPARWELHRARDAIARHHGHHHQRRAHTRDVRRRRRRSRWPGWRGLSGWWRRTVRGECGMDRSGPGRERA